MCLDWENKQKAMRTLRATLFFLQGLRQAFKNLQNMQSASIFGLYFLTLSLGFTTKRNLPLKNRTFSTLNVKTKALDQNEQPKIVLKLW